MKMNGKASVIAHSIIKRKKLADIPEEAESLEASPEYDEEAFNLEEDLNEPSLEDEPVESPQLSSEDTRKNILKNIMIELHSKN